MWTLRYSQADEDYLRAKGAAVVSSKVQPENLWAWSAFQALRGSRTRGGPIPISEIHAYCNLTMVCDTIQRQRLARFVIALDQAEREYGHSKAAT